MKKTVDQWHSNTQIYSKVISIIRNFVIILTKRWRCLDIFGVPSGDCADGKKRVS